MNLMNIAKILGKVGGNVIKAVVPGAGIVGGVIETINDFLPADKRLDGNSTGTQAIEAINSLPAEKQAEVLSKQCDVEIVEAQEWTKRIQALSEADASGSSTRPYIAKMLAQVVSYTVFALVTAMVDAILNDKTATLEMMAQAWPLILGLLGPPVALLRAYFGMRTKEKANRANTALGIPALQEAGGVFSLIKKLAS